MSGTTLWNEPGCEFYILEEDKRATTNVQNGLVFLFLSSFKKP